MKVQQIIEENKRTGLTGIYSVCSAHPLVIEASIEQAKQDGSPVLIEATANQVNQFGGYTGMQPKDFYKFVSDIAKKVDFPTDKIILGGDHLGPVCWTEEPANEAMVKSKELIKQYVEAGFKKIHLDCSMPCNDDSLPLDDAIIAQRAAELCYVAEQVAKDKFGQSDIAYIVGTEVPPPGGAQEELSSIDPTPVNNVKNTINLHKHAFYENGLEQAWQRVVGLVVQPGVEFDHTGIVDYQSKHALELKEFIQTVDNIAYEAHSTDYQTDKAFTELVNDHFAILKVGPAVTFALREALFALSYIEEELVPVEQRSHIRAVAEELMLTEPKNWQKFYPVPLHKTQLYRQFSFSDRIRYYWAQPRATQAIEQLISNLENHNIPLPLLSQFMPEQYKLIRTKQLANKPIELIKSKIKQVTTSYAKACWHQNNSI